MSNAAPKPFNVVLFGVIPKQDNLGVRCLTTSVVQQILAIRPNAQFSLLIGNRTPDAIATSVNGRAVMLRVVNFRLSPRSHFREHLFFILAMALLYRCMPLAVWRTWLASRIPWIAALRAADFVGDLRGGDSFSDIYGLKRLVIGSLPNCIARLIGKRYQMLPQTYGPFASRAGRIVGGLVIRHAARLFARDRHSMRVANCFLRGVATPPPLELCPDLAFTMTIAPPRNLTIDPALPAVREGLLIGLTPSGLLAIGGYTRRNMFGLKSDYLATTERLCLKLLEEPTARLLLVPHVIGAGAESDVPACAELQRRLAQAGFAARVHCVMSIHDERETKAIIGRCGMFIGARMHACIAALSQGIPAIGVAYSRKFRGTFAMAGVAELALNAKALGEQEIIARCVALLGQRTLYATHLATNLAAMRERVRNCMEQALSPLDAPSDATPLPLPRLSFLDAAGDPELAVRQPAQRSRF